MRNVRFIRTSKLISLVAAASIATDHVAPFNKALRNANPPVGNRQVATSLEHLATSAVSRPHWSKAQSSPEWLACQIVTIGNRDLINESDGWKSTRIVSAGRSNADESREGEIDGILGNRAAFARAFSSSAMSAKYSIEARRPSPLMNCGNSLASSDDAGPASTAPTNCIARASNDSSPTSFRTIWNSLARQSASLVNRPPLESVSLVLDLMIARSNLEADPRSRHARSSRLQACLLAWHKPGHECTDLYLHRPTAARPLIQEIAA